MFTNPFTELSPEDALRVSALFQDANDIEATFKHEVANPRIWGFPEVAPPDDYMI